MNGFIATRRFWPLFFAFALGAFADNTLRMSTIVAVETAYDTPGSTIFTLPGNWGQHGGSLVSMAFTIPVMVFSLLAGWLADRMSRSHLIKTLKGAEVALMAMAAGCFALGNAPLLIFALFLMGTQSAFFSPVRNAVMPQYFRENELVRANGMFNAGLFVAVVAGLGLGGLLIGMDNGRTIVSVMLVAAAGLGTVFALFVPEATAPSAAERAARKQLDIPLRTSLAPVIFPMLGIGWFWTVGALILANLPPYVREVVGGTGTDLSLIQALFAVGAGFGSIAAGLIGSRLKDPLQMGGYGVIGTIVFGTIVWILSEGMTAGAGLFRWENTALLISFMGIAACNGVFVVPLFAAVQQRSPNELRARFMGIGNMVNGTGATFGAFMLIPISEAGAQPAQIFLLLSFFQIALLGVMAWRKRTVAKPPPDLTGEELMPVSSLDENPDTPPNAKTRPA